MILPALVLLRLDTDLEPTKAAVVKKAATLDPDEPPARTESCAGRPAVVLQHNTAWSPPSMTDKEPAG
jgi:hypothetical protein